jgi:hypothetical protein
VNKKLFVALILAVALGMGASAQLVIGASGALYMDSQLSSQEITDAFKDGSSIYYGPFAELIFGNLGIGASLNFQTGVDELSQSWMDGDVAAYLSYHLFGGHSFLDPFGELGAGALVTKYDNSDNFFAGTMYWYGALGFGVNLGPIGVFGKLAYDFKIAQKLKQPDSSGLEYEIPYYRAYALMPDGISYYGAEGYFPNLRFTAGVKLIL